MNYMNIAIEEARSGIMNKDGGPFGAVVVKDGVMIGIGHNTVLRDNDPTAHGEINAIRNACEHLKSYDLTGCSLYTTAEPCTMCLCACMWANIENIFYGCTIEDSGLIGFRDDKFNDVFGRKNLDNYLHNVERDKCLELFSEYANMEKTIY